MRVLQINSVLNTGSTGRVTEDIGSVLIANGHDSYIAFGRGERPSSSNRIKIGSQKDVYLHGIKTALLDRHGFGSKVATKDLIGQIKEIKPDVIGLHNLHGYYVHIGVLFNYFDEANIPVVWTLFDCWAFTGHCTYFDDINCQKWQTGCYSCPKTKKYPASYGLDNSKKNYNDKKLLFNLPERLELVVHSQWLKAQVEKSYLGDIPIHHIASGIDLVKFSIRPSKQNLTNKIILGVANTWDSRKGLNDFVHLFELLPTDYQIVLIGLSPKQLKSLPSGIKGITRTEEVTELASWYSKASVFVNPTYQDNFPTTNLEALACGTPVITYNTGGSPEAIDEETGFVVEKGNIEGLLKAVNKVSELGKEYFSKSCRKRALKYYNKEDRYKDYINLYEQVLNK